jgi:hypothetical protein
MVTKDTEGTKDTKVVGSRKMSRVVDGPGAAIGGR